MTTFERVKLEEIASDGKTREISIGEMYRRIRQLESDVGALQEQIHRMSLNNAARQ